MSSDLFIKLCLLAGTSVSTLNSEVISYHSMHDVQRIVFIFRSTPRLSRPNNIRGKCPSVSRDGRTSIHKVFPISVKFGM